MKLWDSYAGITFINRSVESKSKGKEWKNAKYVCITSSEQKCPGSFPWSESITSGITRNCHSIHDTTIGHLPTRGIEFPPEWVQIIRRQWSLSPCLTTPTIRCSFNTLVDETSKSLLKWCMVLIFHQSQKISVWTLFPRGQTLQFLDCIHM